MPTIARLALLVCLITAMAFSTAVVRLSSVTAGTQPSQFCPCDFAPLGHFTASGPVLFNTDTLTYANVSGGVVSDGAAVFTFNSISVPAGSSIVGAGSRPLVLLSKSTVQIAGGIDVSAQSATMPGPGGSG